MLGAVCRWILKELGDDLTDEDIDEMIRDTDKDGSGFVDFGGKFTTNSSISDDHKHDVDHSCRKPRKSINT